MPERFKVTKSDAPEIDATYHSILKDEEAAAVLGKLLPTAPSSIDQKKGEFFQDFFLFMSYFFFFSPFCVFLRLNEHSVSN